MSVKRPLKRPLPPEEPLPGDCCGEGCEPCVFDIYERHLERYRHRLARYEEALRHNREHPDEQRTDD